MIEVEWVSLPWDSVGVHMVHALHEGAEWVTESSYIAADDWYPHYSAEVLGHFDYDYTYYKHCMVWGEDGRCAGFVLLHYGLEDGPETVRWWEERPSWVEVGAEVERHDVEITEKRKRRGE